MSKISDASFARALVLAAGKGTRMNPATSKKRKIPSPIPKVLHKLAGKPIVFYLLKTLNKLAIPATLVIGYKADMVRTVLGPDYNYILQAKQEGTGHAVQVARPFLENKAKAIFVLMGDAPFVSSATLSRMLGIYKDKHATIVLATMLVSNPSFYGFGRIDRDRVGRARKIVEQKNASPQQLKIKECNAGFYLFDSTWLWENVDNLGKTLKGEIPLTDLIKMAYDQNKRIETVSLSLHEAIGINTQEQVKQAERILKKQK